jgi:hypothetical protein
VRHSLARWVPKRNQVARKIFARAALRQVQSGNR